MENIPPLIRRIHVFRQAGNQRGWGKNGNAALEEAQHRQQTLRSFDRIDKWKIKNDLLYCSRTESQRYKLPKTTSYKNDLKVINL